MVSLTSRVSFRMDTFNENRDSNPEEFERVEISERSGQVQDAAGGAEQRDHEVEGRIFAL